MQWILLAIILSVFLWKWPKPMLITCGVLGLAGLAAEGLVRFAEPLGLWPSLCLAITGGVLAWMLCLGILRDPDMALLAGRLRKKTRVPIVDGNA